MSGLDDVGCPFIQHNTSQVVQVTGFKKSGSGKRLYLNNLGELFRLLKWFFR